MRRISKIYTALLASAVVLSTVAGCAKEESAIQIVDDLDAQPEYLSFFSYESYSGSDVTKYWIDRFTEIYNKKVYINFEGAAYYDDEGLSYRELLERRLQSSSPDDVYIINAEDVLEFEKKGYWMDLSGMDFVDNLSEAALYQSTYNGKVFSVPLGFTGFGFIWNVDVLTEHGLTIPGNLEEFMAVCEKLKADGILPYGANKGYALTVPAMCVGMKELYAGGETEQKIAGLNSGDVPVSAYMRDGFEFLEQMIDKGYMDPQMALKSTPNKEDYEMLLAGECAFICGSLGGIAAMGDGTPQLELTGLPVLPEGCISVYGAGSRLCVNPASRHLETALEFIEMVGTREALSESAMLKRTMPSAKDCETAGFPHEEAMVSLLQQPGQIPNQDFALHFNTWENIRDIGREICAGASTDEACAMLDEMQRVELENYRLNN